jgi:hypothetical protein
MILPLPQFAGTESRLSGKELRTVFFSLPVSLLVNRYLTKICDQVVALLSTHHSASIVWGDEDDDIESIDMDAREDDRLFTYEVAKRNEQEESAVSRPGFQVRLSRTMSN